MKKLLFLIPTYSSFYKPIKTEFKKLDWNVKTIDYRRGTIPIRILRFIPLFGGNKKAMVEIEKKIMTMINLYQPDLTLTVKGESLRKDLVKEIKRTHKIVNWFPDPINWWTLIKNISPTYNKFFHFDPLVVKKFKKNKMKNAYYLPFATEIYKQKATKKIYDVSFVGTYSKSREKQLKPIAKNNFNLNIWGDPRWHKSELKNYVRGGRISNNKMKQVIQKSKININIHGYKPTMGANLRTFEVTGSGGFLLSDFVSDLPKLFTINKDVVCYKNSQDMCAKINYYLNNESIREVISDNGYKKAKAKHNYSIRIKQLLKVINEK